MRTNFTYDLDSLKRISGSANGDRSIAEKAAREMEQFANEQFAKINSFLELREVMTLSDESSLHDALTALRHLSAELTSLCEFFNSSHLIDYFDPARFRVEAIVKKAESAVPTLVAHVSR